MKENDEVINKEKNNEIINDNGMVNAEKNNETTNGNEIVSTEDEDETINDEENQNEEELIEEEINEQIEELEEIQEQDRRQKVALVLIIILLLILLLLWHAVMILPNMELYQQSYYAGMEDIIKNEEENIKIIEISDKDINLQKNEILWLFETKNFDFKKIMSTNQKGEYKFGIKNMAHRDIVYDINFNDDMDLPINVKYRLKIDNLYIRGDENTYLDINELRVKDIIVTKDSINLYTLEWSLEDKDTTVITERDVEQYYKVKLEIKINEYK